MAMTQLLEEVDGTLVYGYSSRYEQEEAWESLLVEEVKAAVLEHFALLNSGDARARARHYLPDATGFSMLGGPLVSGGLNSRRVNSNRDAGWRHDLACSDLCVTIYGDTALITFYVHGTITPPGGRPEAINGRSTSVRIKHEGQWKIALTHGSPLACRR